MIGLVTNEASFAALSSYSHSSIYSTTNRFTEQALALQATDAILPTLAPDVKAENNKIIEQAIVSPRSPMVSNPFPNLAPGTYEMSTLRRWMRGKYFFRQLMRGGPIRQTPWFAAIRRDPSVQKDELNDGSYARDFADPRDERDWASAARWLAEDPSVSKFPKDGVIWKPNSGAMGGGIIFFQRDGEENLVLTMATNLLGTTSPATDRVRRVIEETTTAVIVEPPGEDILQMTLSLRGKELERVLNLVWEAAANRPLSSGSQAHDSGVLEPRMSAIRAHGKAYETRHIVLGNFLTGVCELRKTPPTDPLQRDVWDEGWFARFGSSAFLSSWSDRKNARDARGSAMYEPLYENDPGLRDRQAEFEAYVDSFLLQEFDNLSARLRAAGLAFPWRMGVYFDLMWQMPEKPSEFPVPILIEGTFHYPTKGEWMRHPDWLVQPDAARLGMPPQDPSPGYSAPPFFDSAEKISRPRIPLELNYPVTTNYTYIIKGRHSVAVTASHRARMDEAKNRIRLDHEDNAELLDVLDTTEIKLVEGFHVLAHYHLDVATMTGWVVQDLLAHDHPVANLMTIYHEMLHAMLRKRYGIWFANDGEEVAVTYLELAYFFRLSDVEQNSYLQYLEDNLEIDHYRFLKLIRKLKYQDWHSRSDAIVGLIAEEMALTNAHRAVLEAREILKDLKVPGSGDQLLLMAHNPFELGSTEDATFDQVHKTIEEQIEQGKYSVAKVWAFLLRQSVSEFIAIQLYLAGDPEKANHYFPYKAMRGMSAISGLTYWWDDFPSRRFPAISDAKEVLEKIDRSRKIIDLMWERSPLRLKEPEDADLFPNLHISEELRHLFDGQTLVSVFLGDDIEQEPSESPTPPNILKRIIAAYPALANLDLAIVLDGKTITYDQNRIKRMSEEWVLGIAQSSKSYTLNAHWMAVLLVYVVTAFWWWMAREAVSSLIPGDARAATLYGLRNEGFRAHGLRSDS